MTLRLLAVMLVVLVSSIGGVARAQMPGGPPPAIGVVKAATQSVTETSEFIGRVQAVDRVVLTARVTAFLEKRSFVEGTEVAQGDLLYELERGPFEAAVQQQEAAVADTSARLANANIQLSRAQSLLSTPAGQRSNVDDATANQRSLAAQVMSAQAQLRMAQINLGYTEIHAPIAGKISRTAISVGNVVSPSTGPLASIVSQDPMYVLFPVAMRAEMDLEKQYADRGGLNAATIAIRLPDGTMYPQKGTIDYVEPSVQATTDTLLLRAQIANPPNKPPQPGQPVDRPLVDGEFVTIVVESNKPVTAMAIPRAAVLSDQQGDYVYVVDGDNKVQQRRIKLGQSTPTTAEIASGLKDGETVVVEGIQKVRPGMQVTPGPVSAPASPTAPAGH